MPRRSTVPAALLAAVPAVALAVLGAAGPAAATPGSRLPAGATGPLGVVATESPAASRAARDVLEAGGNAVDAAAAGVFAVGVARPQSCGIGGGGFLLYRSASGRVRALDFRETAPAAFRADSLVPPGLHKTFSGHLTVGVPGTVAGMDAALRRYGTLDLAQAMAPGERLARAGFRVPTSFSTASAANAARLRLFPAAAEQFLFEGRSPYRPGSLLRQPDLAATYRRIMRDGPRAFYGGEVARRIVRDMRAPRPRTQDPGLLTVRDFAGYRAVWRDPLAGTYRGRQVFGFPPPTSGGIAILETLNLLEGFDLAGLGPRSADTLHLVAEAQKLAFADRGALVADPDAVDVPTAGLISKEYAGSRRGEIDPRRAKRFGPGTPPAAGTTTHLSVIDRRGNAVAVTCTVEAEFGSAVVAPGTGVLLNNELTDFGDPGTANAPAPGKRPRSSMSPTIVLDAQGRRPSLVLGGAGGARIINGVLLPIIRHVDFGAGPIEAVDAERLDAGAVPAGRLAIEDRRLPAPVLADLEARGHQLVREGEYGPRPRVQAAGVLPDGRRVAVSDPRTDQAALAERPPPPVAQPDG